MKITHKHCARGKALQSGDAFLRSHRRVRPALPACLQAAMIGNGVPVYIITNGQAELIDVLRPGGGR